MMVKMDLISRKSPQATYREIQKLIESKKWDKVLLLITKSKGKKRKGLQSVLQSTQSAVSILSLAIVHDAPIEIIEVILELNPEIASHTDSHGMTPLHITCACRGSSLEIIQLLLQIDNGASANIMDKSKRTPLHHLMTYICYPRPEELEMLMNDEFYSISSRSFSEAHTSEHDDKNSVVSMNQTEFSNASFAMADLFQAAPSTMYIRDCHGNTPIDILHECKSREPKSRRPTPKWERADITTKMFREEMIAFYREKKKSYEKQGFLTAKDKLNQVDNVKSQDASTSSSTVQASSLGSNPTRTDASTLLNFADMSIASESTR